MKNKLSRKKDIKKRSSEKVRKLAAYVVIGILLFGMIFGSFSYLIYALQTV